MKTYKINEMFYSIQEEGSYVGTPMIFIRFSGCNQKCWFCDTKYETGDLMTINEITEKINNSLLGHWDIKDKWKVIPICFTGGEPSLQVDEELIVWFCSQGISLHMETNGSDVPVDFPMYECITISPKSNMSLDWKMLLEEKTNSNNMELKVVFDTKDKTQLQYNLRQWGSYFKKKYIQPVTFEDGTTNVNEVIKYIKQNPEWKLSLQIQKILKIK